MESEILHTSTLLVTFIWQYLNGVRNTTHIDIALNLYLANIQMESEILHTSTLLLTFIRQYLNGVQNTTHIDIAFNFYLAIFKSMV